MLFGWGMLILLIQALNVLMTFCADIGTIGGVITMPAFTKY